MSWDASRCSSTGMTIQGTMDISTWWSRLKQQWTRTDIQAVSLKNVLLRATICSLIILFSACICSTVWRNDSKSLFNRRTVLPNLRRLSLSSSNFRFWVLTSTVNQSILLFKKVMSSVEGNKYAGISGGDSFINLSKSSIFISSLFILKGLLHIYTQNDYTNDNNSKKIYTVMCPGSSKILVREFLMVIVVQAHYLYCSCVRGLFTGAFCLRRVSNTSWLLTTNSIFRINIYNWFGNSLQLLSAIIDYRLIGNPL